MTIWLVLERWGGEFIAAYSTQDLAYENASHEFDRVVEYIVDLGYLDI